MLPLLSLKLTDGTYFIKYPAAQAAGYFYLYIYQCCVIVILSRCCPEGEGSDRPVLPACRSFNEGWSEVERILHYLRMTLQYELRNSGNNKIKIHL